MSYEEPKRFEPPEHGLLSGENIEWEQKAGTPFMIIFCGGCLPLSSVFLLPIIAAIFGATITLYIGFFMLVGILYYVSSFVRIRRTKYFLTTQRIIEVQGGDILQEIPLDCFTGKSPDAFLKIKEDHRSGAYTYFSVRLYDSDSRKVIVLKGIREDAIDRFKRLG